MSVTRDCYKSDDEIEEVVRGFESCATPPSAFDHRAHLTVAFSYLRLSKLTLAEAAERMRIGLHRYLDHNGVDRQKYNETITLFWIKLVRSFLDGVDAERNSAGIANGMLEALGNSQLIFEYYSKERLLSDEARVAWVEPDVVPIEFLVLTIFLGRDYPSPTTIKINPNITD
jgi:hypothetical protein